jgi:phage terminase large subunit
MPAVKAPGSIIDGIDLLNKLKVYYTSDSPNLKYEQENYSYAVDRYGMVMEEPEDNNNHIAGDPPRYIAQYLFARGIIRIKG